MSIFDAQLAFSGALLALTAGTMLTVWSYREKGAGILASRIAGYFILILAAFTLLCTAYNSVKYWEEGAFSSNTRHHWYRHEGKQSDRMHDDSLAMRHSDRFRNERFTDGRGEMQRDHRPGGRQDLLRGGNRNSQMRDRQDR